METDLRHIGDVSIGLLTVGIQASVAPAPTPPQVRLAQAEFGVQDIPRMRGAGYGLQRCITLRLPLRFRRLVSSSAFDEPKRNQTNLE